MNEQKYTVYVDGYYMTKAETKEQADGIAEAMREELKQFHNSMITNARSWCARFNVNSIITVERA